jgi:hypothetical protein
MGAEHGSRAWEQSITIPPCMLLPSPRDLLVTHCYPITADGQLVATGGDDGKVKLWNTLTGTAGEQEMPPESYTAGEGGERGKREGGGGGR